MLSEYSLHIIRIYSLHVIRIFTALNIVKSTDSYQSRRYFMRSLSTDFVLAQCDNKVPISFLVVTVINVEGRSVMADTSGVHDKRSYCINYAIVVYLNI